MTSSPDSHQQPQAPSAPPLGPAPRRRRRRWPWLVALGLLLAAGFVPLGPLHSIVRAQLASALARQTGREVRVGPVRGSLFTGAVVEGAAIAGLGGFGEDGRNEQLTAQSLRVRYSLLSLLMGWDPLRAVRSITIERPVARMTWRSDSTLDLIELFKSKRPLTAIPTFVGTVKVVDGRLTLLDERHPDQGTPRREHFENVDGELDFVRRGEADVKVSVESPGFIESTALSGRLTLDGGWRFAGQTDLRGANLERLAPYANPLVEPSLKLLSGTVSAQGTARLERPKDPKKPFDSGFDLNVTCLNCAFEAQPLVQPLSGVTGTIHYRQKSTSGRARDPSDLIEFTNLRATVAGAQLIADGTATELADPVLNVRVRGTEVSPARLAAALRAPGALQRASGSGAVAFDVRLRGKRGQWQASGWADPRGVGWSGLGELTGGRLTFNARQVASGLAGWVGQLGLQNVSGTSPRLQAPFTGWNGQALLERGDLRLTRVAGRLGQASLAADGRIRDIAARAASTVDLNLRVAGLSPLVVRPLLPARFQPRDAAGTFSGEVRVTGSLSSPRMAGRVALPAMTVADGRLLGGGARFDLRLGPTANGWAELDGLGFQARGIDLPLTALTGRAEVVRGEIRLSRMRGRLGGDAFFVEGRARQDLANFNLRLRAPSLDLGRALAGGRLPGWRASGRAAANLALSGSPTRFKVVGRVSVPQLRGPQATIERATLDLDTWVRPRSGLGGLDGRIGIADAVLRARGLAAPLTIRSADLRATGQTLRIARFDGQLAGDPIRLSGTVNGLPQPRRVDLRLRSEAISQATLDAAAPKAQVSLDAPAAVDLHIHGPWPTPRVEGSLLARGLTLRGQQPVTFAGTTNLRLTLASTARGKPLLPATGLVQLVDGRLRLGQGEWTATDANGWLSLARDGSIRVVKGPGDLGPGNLTARLGQSPVQLAGAVYLKRQGSPEVDLTVDAPDLRMADLSGVTQALPGAPAASGEGTLSLTGVRVTGTLDRLRIASGSGADGWVTLPERLVVGDSEVRGGRARLDIVLVKRDGRYRPDGEVELVDSVVRTPGIGTVARVTGLVRLADGQLQVADLDAALGQGTLAVRGRGRDGALVSTVEARGVSPADLAPALGAAVEQIDRGLIDADLVIEGPTDNLTIRGWSTLRSGPGGEPTHAALTLRVIKGDPALPAEVFGLALLAGGDLHLTTLEVPLHDLRGEVRFTRDRAVLDGVSVLLADVPLRLAGQVTDLPRGLFDLTARAEGLDVGALASTVLVAPADDPSGPKISLWQRLGVPPLVTPEGSRLAVTLRGPSQALVASVEAEVPRLALRRTDAIPNPDGSLPSDSGAGLVTIATGLTVGGQAVGSLGPEPLPTGSDAAQAVVSLAGLAPLEAPSGGALPTKQTLLDRFVADLRADVKAVNPRQALALFPVEERTKLLDGPLGAAQALQPAHLAAQVQGSLREPEVLAQLSSRRWLIGDLPLRELSAAVRLATVNGERLLTIDKALATVRGGLVTAAGALKLPSGQRANGFVRVKADNLELASLSAAGLTREQVAGLADGEAVLQLGGTGTRAAGTLHGSRLRLANQRLGDGEVEFKLSDQVLHLRRLVLSNPDTNALARLSGSVGLADDGALALTGDVRGFDLETLAPLLGADSKLREGLSGRLDFAGAITGTRRFPLLDGLANVSFGSLAGLPFMRLSLRAEPSGSDSLNLTAELNDAAYQGHLTGQVTNIDTVARRANYALSGQLTSRDLGQVTALASRGNRALSDTAGRVLGEVALTGALRPRESGPRAGTLNPIADLRGMVSLNLTDSERSKLRIAGVELDRAVLKATADANQVRFEQLEVGRGETQIALQSGVESVIHSLDTDPTLDVHLASPTLRYEDLVSLTHVPMATAGHFRAEAHLTGPLDDVAAQIRVATESLVLDGESVPDQIVSLRLRPKEVLLDGPVDIDLFGVRVQADGGWRNGQPVGNLQVRLHDLSRLRAVTELIAKGGPEYKPRAWQTRLRGFVDSLPPLSGGTVEMVANVVDQGIDAAGSIQLRAEGVVSPGPAGDRPVPPLVAQIQLGGPLTDEPPAWPESPRPGVIYVNGVASLGSQSAARTRLWVGAEQFDLAPYAAWSERLAGLGGTADVRGRITFPEGKLAIDGGQLNATGLSLGEWRVASVRASEVGWSNSRLSFSPLEVEERSLLASLSGSIPLEIAGGNVKLLDDPRRLVDVRGGVDIFDLSDFEHLMGSVGRIEGNAKLELLAQGRASTARVAGAATVQMPLLQLVDRGPATAGAEPQSNGANEGQAASQSLDRRGELALLKDTQVQIAVDQNQVRIEQFSGSIIPTTYAVTDKLDEATLARDRAAGLIGSFEVHETGDQPAVVLRTFDPQRLLENPVNVAFALREVSGRGQQVDLRHFNLNGAIAPTVAANGRPANRLQLESAGWVNDGWATLVGEIITRVGDPRRWSEQEYHLRASTQSLDPQAPEESAERRALAQAPKSAHPRLDAAGRVTYPVVLNDPALGFARLMADVGLDSHTKEFGPLTLWGKVVATESLIREGALGLLLTDPNRPRRDWPAAPVLRLTVSAPDLQSNRIVMRVPAVNLPFVGSVTLSETPQRLRVDGSVDVSSGSVYASVLRTPLEVQSGTATVRVQRNAQTGRFEPNAEFDSRSETTLRAPRSGSGADDTTDYRVSLRVRGTVRPGVDKPETEFRVDARSTPPLPEEVIFARLSTSTELAAALQTGAMDTFLKDELANAALQTALSYTLTPVFDEIRRSIGLDEFSITYELNQPLEVRVGKYLLKNFYTSLRVGFNERGEIRQVVRFNYRLSKSFTVGMQYDSQDDTRVTVEYNAGF